MWRVTLKGLVAHKFRLLLTSLAIVLGVSFIAGTLVLTDTIGSVFDNLMTDSTRGVDVAVRTKQAFDPGAQGGGSWTRDPVPASLVSTVAAVPGVRAFDGWVGGYAQFVDKRGTAIKNAQAPTLGMSTGSTRQITNGLHVVAGTKPMLPGEVVMDQNTAQRHDFHVGDRVRILFQGPPEEYTIVGIVKFGDAGNLAGATLAGFETTTAQRVLNRLGKYDTIQLAAEPGVSQTTLRDRVAKALRTVDPVGRYEAVTGKALARERVNDFRQTMSFFNTFMLVFALIALFVGAFIIYNTFSIVVAQRARELGLLRALGASRRQVTSSVTGEALVVGAASSVVGVVFGIGVAFGLEALMKGIGISLPGGATQILPRTVIVSVLAGMLVTLIAATSPARRAARVSPIEALHSEAAAPGSGWRRYAVGGVVFTAGLAGVGIGLFGDVSSDSVPGGAAGLIGAASMLLFVGVAMLSPLLARPLAQALGWYPAHVRGEAGLLARENALRNTRRTASTAAALMIGLALMTFVTIFGASAKASVSKAVDQSVRADWILMPTGQGTVSPQVEHTLTATNKFSAVVGFRTGVWQDRGTTRTLIGTDTDKVQQVLDMKMLHGTLSGLNAGGVLVYKDAAAANGWRVGDVLRMRFENTGYRDEPIRGIFGENRAIGSNYVISLDEYARNYTDQLDVIVAARNAPGVTTKEAKATLHQVLRAYPSVDANNQAQYKAAIQAQFDTLLNLMQALLILSVLIAVLGIVNTLALSIFERTRELGLLRAVGMTRGQVRSMIRWESLIIAVFGAVLGLGIGLGAGRLVVAALSDKGVALAVPITQIALLAAVGAVAGLVASVLPARRATRVDVLRAVHAD
jgi:putative ABC transport system permease protein